MKAYKGRYSDQTIRIREVYADLFASPPPIVALDIETISLKNKTVMGIGFGLPNDDNFYFDIFDTSLPWHLIWNSATRKIWHNATFDLSREALGKFGADITNIEDTAILTRLLNIPTELSIASEATGQPIKSMRTVLDEYKVTETNKLPWKVLADKCLDDVHATMSLYLKYRDIVNNEYYEIERRNASMLLHESHRGVALDQDLVSAIYDELDMWTRKFEDNCEMLGFNPHSGQQVAYALSTQGIALPWPRKRNATQPSTSRDILEKVQHSWAALTLLARKYRKLRGVISNLLSKPRAYSHFHMDAVTGRIASYDIQMHNLPTGARLGDIVPSAGPIRRVFIPDEGTFTRFDLGQIELRVLAYLSGDVRMTEILSLPKDEGGDMHLNTMKVLGIYSKVMAKNFNFGTMFGGDVETLAKFTGINDLNLLRQYQYQMRLEYPQLFTWIDQQRRDGLRNMSVETIYGRTLRLDQSKNPNELSEKHIMNCAVNYPVQGSAAEIFKRLRIACLQYIPLDKYVLQVHDEQLFDSDHSLPKEELEHLAPFWTPMDISIVNRWQ